MQKAPFKFVSPVHGLLKPELWPVLIVNTLMACFIIFIILYLGLALSPFALFVVALFSVFCVCFSSGQSLAIRCPHPLIVLGSFVPVLSMLGSGSLLLAALAFLLIFREKPLRAELSWAAPFLLILVIWVINRWIAEFHLGFFEVAWEYQQLSYDRYGIAALSRFFQHNTPGYILASVALLRVSLLCVFAYRFSHSNSDFERFLTGLCAGIFVSLALIGFQWLVPGSGWFAGENEFWTSLNRLSGTFTDPNAFGVFFALLLPLLVYRGVSISGNSLTKRATLVLFVVVYIAVGSLAGSRSFFLGLFIYGVAGFLLIKKPRVVWLIPAACLLVLVGIQGGMLNQLPVDSLPEGVQRVAAALDIARLSETFHSRIVFFKLAKTVWIDHWLFGVGFISFREVAVSYADLLGLGTGSWSDNANSFYLGILCELGLLGALAFIFSLRNLRLRSDYSILFLWAFICLALLLFIGPHIEFDEIALLTALIVGRVFYVNASTINLARPVSCFLILIVGVAICSQAHLRGRGFYPWELHSGEFYRWSTGASLTYVPCDTEGRAKVQFKVVHPDLAREPVEVELRSPGQIVQSFIVTNPLDGSAEFVCPTIPSKAPGLFSRPASIPVEVSVSRLWIPEHFEIGTDPRPLGIQLYGIAPRASIRHDWSAQL